MPTTPQVSINNDFGVELTVGVVCNSDRMAIVMPMVTSDTTLHDSNRCQDAVDAFIASGLPLFLACMSGAAYVAYVQAEGMVDGMVPARHDYAANTQNGGYTMGTLPSNVTGLITYYEDPRDIGAGRKMRTAHTFMPGVPPGEVSGDIISVGLVANYDAFAAMMQAGYNTIVGGTKWWRVLSAPWQLTANPLPPPAKPFIRTRPRGIAVPRIIGIGTRAYVSTQRRRLIPHQ